MELTAKTIHIMEEFLRDYEANLTGSEIAKRKKLNQKTVSTLLKELEKKAILKSITQGKNRLYSINLEDEGNIILFISSIEHMRALAFYNRHLLIKEVCMKILPFCEGIVAVFGSYAKGNQKQSSDVDIFIAGTADIKEIDKLGEIYKLDLSLKLYPLPLFKKSLQNKDPLTEELIKSHILLKGTQEFVSCVRKFRYGKN
ncbi:MAG: nucleotidyltransferase domain-containing protein [Nanoarchaeota archaeon]